RLAHRLLCRFRVSQRGCPYDWSRRLRGSIAPEPTASLRHGQPTAQARHGDLQRRLRLGLTRFDLTIELEQQLQRALQLRSVEGGRLVGPAPNRGRVESEIGNLDARSLLLAGQ